MLFASSPSGRPESERTNRQTSALAIVPRGAFQAERLEQGKGPPRIPTHLSQDVSFVSIPSLESGVGWLQLQYAVVLAAVKRDGPRGLSSSLLLGLPNITKRWLGRLLGLVWSRWGFAVSLQN